MVNSKLIIAIALMSAGSVRLQATSRSG